MIVDPTSSHVFWIVVLVLLGGMLAFRISGRRGFQQKRIVRKTRREPRPGDRVPEDRGPENRGPDKGPDKDGAPRRDVAGKLRWVRLQIIMAAIGIASLTFIAFMGAGEDPKGIPLPQGLFDLLK